MSSLVNSFLGKDVDLSSVSSVMKKSNTADDGNILDADWAKDAFVVPDKDIGNPTDVINRSWSSASAKYVDCRLGCNIGVNPRPQLTRYSDIRVKGRLRGRNPVSITNASGNYGLGRAYSEMYDDPAQKVYFRFGVPQFNSLTTYLSRAFSAEQMIMARTGRAPSGWYTAGKVIGTVIPLVYFPSLTLTVMAGKALNWVFSKPTSKFFTLKPTMHLYWGMVNHLVNNHAVNTGIFKKILADEENQRLGQPYKLDAEDMKNISDMMPDIFNGHGFFDIYALANKGQRIANQVFMEDFEALNRGTSTDYVGYLRRDNSGDGTHTTYISDKNSNASLAAILNEAFMFANYGTDSTEVKQEMDPRVDPDSKEGKEIKNSDNPSHFQQMLQYADAEFRDGSQFAVFRVDHTGPQSEAWGNSVTESDLGQKLNGISSQFKEAQFTFGNGNIVGGAIGEAIQGVVGAAVNVLAGAADGITLGFSNVIMGLAGNGYMDIPKHWQSSSFTPPRMSYTMSLISPYNNPISRMINIWIPFYMLLAGVIPRSTGKQSYTSPFYCQVFDRGRVQSRLAMIESMSVTRGNTNLQFDTYGNAIGLEVTINVVDLSTIMHMPMSTGGIFETDTAIDEDNIAADYLAVLAGMDVYSQIYPFSQAQLKLAKKLTQLKGKFFSPAFHTSYFKNEMLDANMPIVSNVIEAFVRGNAGTEGPLR